MIKNRNPETKKKELAEKLKVYRRTHNISQEELAKFIGTSVFSISRWERKKHLPPTSTVKLMKMLGIL